MIIIINYTNKLQSEECIRLIECIKKHLLFPVQENLVITVCVVTFGSIGEVGTMVKTKKINTMKYLIYI